MTQAAIQLPTTPPLSGADLVTITNEAFQTIATDFAGPDDPAALAGPYMTWADTSTTPPTRRRRNAADTAWISEGPIFTEPAAKTGDSAQTFKAAPSAAADNVVVQSQVLGIAQTLQAVTRTLGATNVNTTGKPIFAYMEGTSNAANASMAIVVSGRQAVISYSPSNIGGALAVSTIVPVGANYIYSASGFASVAFGELR